MKVFVIIAAVLALAATANAKASPGDRAKAMLARMNFTEKVNMLHG